MAVRYYDQHVHSKLKNKRKLAAFLEKLVKKHRKKAEKINLTYIFCNDDYLLEINKEYLQHETLTDIITFDLSENADNVDGEVYISIERVRENAEKFRVTYEEELHRVIFHGALHLCGFKDKKTPDKDQMRRQENLCLKQYSAETDAV
jgi:probable rRNA maturation factor